MRAWQLRQLRQLAVLVALPLLLAAAAPGRDGLDGIAPEVVDGEVLGNVDKHVPVVLDKVGGVAGAVPGIVDKEVAVVDKDVPAIVQKDLPAVLERVDEGIEAPVSSEEARAEPADGAAAAASADEDVRSPQDTLASAAPAAEGGATNDLAAGLDAVKDALVRGAAKDGPGTDKPEDTAGEVPFILDAGEPLDAPQEPSDALLRARKTLQKTLDQVLHEAEEWVQHARGTGQDAADDEYYDDDGEADGSGTTPEEAINKTRAELQRTLEQMLTEAQYEALVEAMAEEGEEFEDDVGNALPEGPARSLQDSTTSMTADVVATEGPRGAAVTESQPTSTASSTEIEVSSTEAPTTSTGAPSSTEAPTTSTETPSSTEFTSTETATWVTEENLYGHLVVSLGEDAAADGAVGTAAIQQESAADTRAVDVPDDAIEAVVAAAAAVHADRQVPSSASCPTKQPAPLRLPALPNAAPESDNPQCARDSRLLDLHVRNHTLWAAQMQDAGAGGITGLLDGNVYHLGDFDECMDVAGPVRAQYCVAEVRVHPPPRTPDYRHHPDARPDPMQSVWNHIKHEGEAWRLPLDTLHVALCAPASCGARDLQDAIQIALNDHADCANLPVAYTVTVRDVLCTSPAEQSPPLSTGEVVYIVVVALLALAVLVGTAIDVYATDKKSCVRWLLVLFSLPRSWRLLSKADPKPMGLDLDPLSGARTVNMVVLVIAHRGFNMLRGPVHNYNLYETMPRALQHTGATHAQLFVDTCFVMSGLLVALLELTKAHALGKDRDARSTLLPSMVHRYVRLTPSYAMVVFFYATLFWRFGSGPLWDQVIGHESAACAKYWWTNMFYVNNYVDSDKLCMFQSWYMPCDLHLFFVGYVVMGVVASHRRTGLALLLVLLVASVLVPFFVTLQGSKPALLEMLPNLFRAPDQSDNFRTMYAPTHIRAAPYMVGLLVGYLFQRLALRHKERFTQGVTWLLCLGGVSLTTAALLSSVVFYDPDLGYNGFAAGLYAALCPVVWSAGVCLVLASLVLGSRTLMSSILAWKPLVTLSRLTYNVYLVHWAFQIASVAKARAPFHLDVYNLFYFAFGDLVMSFLVSLGLFLLVEAPFRSLSRKITETPPESIVHIQAAKERNHSALEAGFTGAIPKQNSGICHK